MKDKEYFRKFPLISYRGASAVNLLRRVDFNKDVKNYLSVFYEYTMNQSDRIEDISYNYYNDVDLDWLIYHINDIIDPYYDTVIDDNTLDNLIKLKYGSIEKAKKQVICYRSNWNTDSTILDVNGYNSLPGENKKFWNPIVSQFGIIGYERKEEDRYVTTNVIETFSFVEEINTPFEVGDIISIPSDSLNTSATVVSCNTSSIIVHHVQGSFNKESNFVIQSDNTDTTATVNYTTYKLLQNVIPEIEQVYYTKYTAYEYEQEINENKRNIYLVDRSYSEKLNKQLDRLMK